MLTQPHLRADLMRETARRCARVTRRGCSPMVDGGALTASIRSQSDAQAAEPRQAPCANADGVVTTLATQALIPGSTGRHQMESVPQLSSQDGSGRVQLKDFGPTRNWKVQVNSRSRLGSGRLGSIRAAVGRPKDRETS
jgi:hypothetical protein